jgi:hypothetical protein
MHLQSIDDRLQFRSHIANQNKQQRTIRLRVTRSGLMRSEGLSDEVETNQGAVAPARGQG